MTRLFSNPQLERLSEYIESNLALKYAPERWYELELKIARAAKELRFDDARAFAEVLLSSDATIERSEVLASYLTIGETYFWREPMVFEALETRILPKLAQARRESGEKHLRIWSAGCSSGEEAYSLAVALRRSLPDIEEWNVSILATDINPRKLQKAREGIYGGWSFRNPPPWLIQGYFEEQRSGKRKIKPELRKMVSFEYLNLNDDIYPSPLNDTQAMDIILCRNVLMYFTPDRAREIVGRFRRCLSEGGTLAVGICELSMPIFEDFELVQIPESSIYRKPSSSPILSWPKLPEPVRTRKRTSIKQGTAPAVIARAKHPRLRTKSVSPSARERIERLAGLGRLPEALSACEAAIGADKLDPRLHFLKAAILQEMNREEEAAESLRRTIYLDPSSLSATYSLGNLLLRRSDTNAARRYFRHALSLLEGLDDEVVLTETGGLTVRRFREILSRTMPSTVREIIANDPEGESL